jgi:hypothetical protein
VSPSASLEFAGLEIQFDAVDPRALELVWAATTVSPTVVEGRKRHPPAVSARLSEGPEPRWVPDGRHRAAAESPLDSVSFVAVLRAAMCQALSPEGALLHAAGVVLDDQGILLIAPSEGGKTTISRLLSSQADILSDETICVRPDDRRPGQFLLYGSCFWSGPAYPSRAGGFPLRAICFLRKGPLGLAALPLARALRELLAELHLPIGPTAIVDSLALADRLVASAPIQTLSFALDSNPAPLLRELLVRATV